MKELVDPETGYSALVVGTAHVSGPAAKEVQQLLEETQVEICAVELDKERLKSSLLRLRRLRGEGDGADTYTPDTPWKVLTVLSSKKGGPGKLAYLLLDSFSHSILGVPYGVDMLTAVSTASRLGIRIVPIDRPSNITMARCANQMQHFTKMRERFEKHQQDLERQCDQAFEPLPSSQDLSRMSPKERRVVAMRRMKDTLREVAKAVGCPDPEATIGSFVTSIHSAMDNQEVDAEDLRRVRTCAVKLVEFMRHAAEVGAGAENGPGKDSSGEAGREEKVKHLMAAMQINDGPPAIVAERDLILAQNLRLCTQQGPTLAVVGAGHVPGITRRWEDALSPASLDEAKKYFVIPGRPHSPNVKDTHALEEYTAPAMDGQDAEWSAPSVPVQPMWRLPVGPVLVGTGLGILGFYRPRAATILGGLTLGFLGSGAYIAASGIATAGKAAKRLEEASKKLAMESEEGLL